MVADPPISSNVSPVISTERVGQYPEHPPGLAYAHMVSVVRGQACRHDNGQEPRYWRTGSRTSRTSLAS
jgi:hypothetical protein